MNDELERIRKEQSTPNVDNIPEFAVNTIDYRS
jgi:hypothetical protein